MEIKIIFLILLMISLYLLYDGFFPPAGKKSYIQLTIDKLLRGVNNE